MLRVGRGCGCHAAGVDVQAVRDTAVMPMPKPNENAEDSYRTYYGGLTTEESKLKFLQMLKERRDWHQDFTAAKLLAELAQRWVVEKCPTR